MGEHLLEFWRWLLNTVQQAAIAEAPAVMTAAGHKINRTTNKVEYNHAYDKDVKQLRSNLTAIGEAGVNAPGTAKALELGYNIVRHPKQTYKATKHAVSYLRKNLKPIKPVYKITAENAASITPELWTAAQDAAIARGDMAEAQRLRDLHFKISAPKTEVVDINGNPQLVVHKTPETFTVFDNNRSIGKLNWFATPNAYGENGVFATGAGKNPRTMKLYVNMRNAHKPTIDEGIEPAYINQGEDGLLGIVDKDMTNYFKSSRDAGEGFMMSGGVDNPNALKSADVVTYDNNGVRIPLGKRDNFNMNDIRYALFPFVGGGVGYGLYNTYDR